MTASTPRLPPLSATESATAPTFDAPPGWRAIDLLSDLHLAENTPEVFEAWAAHLESTDADAVFILGDLFEVWIGDDINERGFEARCVEVLAAAARRRLVTFMPGNRDFLVGDAMLESAGVVRFADPTIVVAFGERVLLSHGDALCIDDVAYQRYRSVARRPFVQRAFAVLPLAARRAIGRSLRRQGGRRPTREHGSYVDVDDGAALAWLRDADAATLVHGHTHRPASHVLAPGTVRHVLSDWELDGSTTPRAEILRWDATGFARIAPSTPRPPAAP
ncbi:MAG TPA: UDP-2,3-diacylglucosamine diphosphatase [Caldimonas sp.]|jgi:UDP-2,3-diacylglucosamine hydrolase|nr:UDP-2,3-diacylglucosamine diphosphatase [Caldimonas sp.]HEX4235906.1 UDP-2,3-diacylglucosamine diphosphatase [Caldimonas sp.]